MQVQAKIYRTKYTEIWLDEEEILWLKPDPETELDQEEVAACFDTYREMGINPDHKVLQIIDARVNVSMNKEGRDYAALHGHDCFIASAVISSSLSVRLIVNFFNFFYKASVPLKMFDTEESAKKWLARFR